MAARSLNLDHIIILVPYEELSHPPQWLTQNFTITPGGRHADGKTENRLICLRDGSYIELIAFINNDPKLRAGHHWDKPYGIVDYAFTTADGAQKNFADLQERLEANEDSAVRYEEPRKGSRKRDDGVEIQWEVTLPRTTNGYQRGELPFFCHDITSRSMRVPLSADSTNHPSLTYGIKELTVFVAESKINALIEAYSAIFDAPNATDEDNFGMFAVERMNSVNAAAPLVGINIQVPEEDWQVAAMEERGGVMIGDLVVGGIPDSGTPDQVDRIDTENLPYGIGRVFRDLEIPPNWAVAGEEDEEEDAASKDNQQGSAPPNESPHPNFMARLVDSKGGLKPNKGGPVYLPPSGNLTGKARE